MLKKAGIIIDLITHAVRSMCDAEPVNIANIIMMNFNKPRMAVTHRPTGLVKNQVILDFPASVTYMRFNHQKETASD